MRRPRPDMGCRAIGWITISFILCIWSLYLCLILRFTAPFVFDSNSSYSEHLQVTGFSAVVRHSNKWSELNYSYLHGQIDRQNSQLLLLPLLWITELVWTSAGPTFLEVFSFRNYTRWRPSFAPRKQRKTGLRLSQYEKDRSSERGKYYTSVGKVSSVRYVFYKYDFLRICITN
jgi:hypothetical protein